MITVKAAVDQLNVLIDKYQSLTRADSAESSVLANRLEAAIARLTLPGSTYAQQIVEAQRHFTKIHELIAVATALRDDLQAGWFESITELVHADTHSDFLEMAEGLLDAGYKDAAAVITGSSLEVHIRSLCGKHNVGIEVSGKPKKADTMNADLKKADVYGALEQKQVTAWLDLRNSAAHGDYARYDAKDVGHLIRGIRDFMVKYPA